MRNLFGWWLLLFPLACSSWTPGTPQPSVVVPRKYKTNRMLNTLINAAGVRKDDKSLVDDFGDPSLSNGVVDEVMV
jgi:hypothetical protein